MAARSDSSLAVVLLTQRLVDASASPLKASECWSLLERVPDPAVLLGLGVDEIASLADVDVDRAQQMRGLFDAATAVAFALDELEQSGIRVADVSRRRVPDVVAWVGQRRAAVAARCG